MTKSLVHFSYHKCLTVYFFRVASSTFNRYRLGAGQYRNFNHEHDAFLAQQHKYRVTSVSSMHTDLDALGDDVRATHFVRDPRDLVVSGYFYHKRGAEAWTRKPSPSAKIMRAWLARARALIPRRILAVGSIRDFKANS